jgi:hypothetical protein
VVAASRSIRAAAAAIVGENAATPLDVSSTATLLSGGSF